MDDPKLTKRTVQQIRQPRNPVEARTAYARLVENERNRHGDVEAIGTIFLTNKECPFRCTMCDLWKNTLIESVSPGDIPHQIATAIKQLPTFDSIKLYNSGNFFDAAAIPVSDYPAIASLVSGYRDCIVENHPKLVSTRCQDFAEMIVPAQLEVAIGLETCHQTTLEWLNKSMTLTDFDRAAEKLQAWSIETRVFLLLGLPFMSPIESLEWTLKSIEYAAGRGVNCFSIIPTRPTMPELSGLQTVGQFHVPSGTMVEAVLEHGIKLALGRVFLDLWDAGQFFSCSHCREKRLERLNAMNLQQVVLPQVRCDFCEAAA